MEGDNQKSMKLKTRQITDVAVDVTFPYYCKSENNYYKLTQIEGRSKIRIECVRPNLYISKLKSEDYDFSHYLITCIAVDGIYFEDLYDAYRSNLEPWHYSIESFRGRDQKVNENESAVRVTCIETGKVVECSEHRSRYQNIEQAKRMLNEER